MSRFGAYILTLVIDVNEEIVLTMNASVLTVRTSYAQELHA